MFVYNILIEEYLQLNGYTYILVSPKRANIFRRRKSIISTFMGILFHAVFWYVSITKPRRKTRWNHSRSCFFFEISFLQCEMSIGFACVMCKSDGKKRVCVYRTLCFFHLLNEKKFNATMKQRCVKLCDICMRYVLQWTIILVAKFVLQTRLSHYSRFLSGIKGHNLPSYAWYSWNFVKYCFYSG